MKHLEIPLILFTVFSQMAVGILIFSLSPFLIGDTQLLSVNMINIKIGFGLLVLAMVFSVFHLVNPLLGIRSLINFRTSWLSREIWLLLFILLIISSWILFSKTYFVDSGYVKAVLLIALILFLLTTSRVYYSKSYPTYSYFKILIMFGITTIITSAAWLGITGSSVYREQILLNMLLFAPFFYGIIYVLGALNQQTIIRKNSRELLKTPLFYLQMTLYIISIGILITNKSPLLLFITLFLAEICGRFLFFNNNSHTSKFIGQSSRYLDKSIVELNNE